MQINITGHNIDVTPALRDYATKKLEHLTHRGNHITSVKVTFDIEKVHQIAKGTLHLAGKEIFAQSEAPDLYSAIDLLVDKLTHQITKHKEKMKNHQGNGHHENYQEAAE